MFPGSQVKLSHKSFFSDWISCDMNLPSLKIEKFVTGDGRSVPLLLTGNETESEALNQTVIENCVYRKNNNSYACNDQRQHTIFHQSDIQQTHSNVIENFTSELLQQKQGATGTSFLLQRRGWDSKAEKPREPA